MYSHIFAKMLLVITVVVTANLLPLSTPASADTTTYHPNQQSAFAACQTEYAYLNTDACITAPRNYTRWCDTACIGNSGGGLYHCAGKEQLWTAVTLGYSCSTLAANPIHRFVFPSSPCAAGTTLVGPTSTDCIANSAIPATAKQIGEGVSEGRCLASSGNTAPSTTGTIGNPCHAGTGNKVETEVDYAGGDGVPSFARTYNSTLQNNLGLGYGWTANQSITIKPKGTNAIAVRFGAGRELLYTQTLVGLWHNDPDIRIHLNKDATGYTLFYPDGSTDRFGLTGLRTQHTNAVGQSTIYGYSTNGSITSITGPFGHKFLLTYDGTGRLSTLKDPANQITTYTYDTKSNLIKVTYPGGKYRQYHYEDVRFPHHLTGITDENLIRFATFAYNANGQTVTTQHAQTDNPVPQERFTLNYDTDTQTTVTDAAGTSETYTFTTQNGMKLLTGRTGQDGKTLSQGFNGANQLTTRTDEEGRTTTYTYNATAQLENKTEAYGTAQARTTVYHYLTPDSDRLARIDTPSVLGGAIKSVLIGYDTLNRPYTFTETGYTTSGQQITRTTTLGYNSQGRVNAIDGPRTDVNDVTTLVWNECTTGAACGQLHSLTNALNQTTTFDSYDLHGRLTQSTDPNGLVTVYTYTQRGWLATVKQTPPTGSFRLTQYGYDYKGRLTGFTTPDGIVQILAYDAADNLKTVTDNQGNQLVYGYDSRGNRTLEQAKDPDGTLVRSTTAAFDLRNHPSWVSLAGNTTTTTFDAVGNLTRSVDPQNGLATTNSFDALNRLTATLDRLNHSTLDNRDVTGRIETVTAPNGAATTLSRDDFNRPVLEASADRGATAYTTDTAGNVTVITDARGITASYGFDALNRLTGVSYPNTSENVVYTYDSCSNGVGRLCHITDAAGSTDMAYDAFGNVLTHTRTELGVTYTTRYSFDAGNRVLTVTTPGGKVITYSRNPVGRIQGIGTTVNGISVNLVSGRSYRADGLVKGQTFGNNIAESRIWNLRGELQSQTIGSLDTRTYGFDANGNRTSLQTSTSNTVFGYDVLDRLNGVGAAGMGYDSNGNRTSDGRGTYSYLTSSNRLTTTPEGSLSLDPAGNTMSDGLGRAYTYSNAGALSSVSLFGTTVGTYSYDFRNLRSRKTTSAGTTVFQRDLAGRILAESDSAGNTLRTYIWDDGYQSVAQIDVVGGSERVTYLHTDPLGTPVLGTDSTGKVVWKGPVDPFGAGTPSEDPDGNGVLIKVNLRMPGQYYDAESNLHENGQRYYDPMVGRYVTSDPTGIAGGINAFGYANANPLAYTDPTGEVGIFGALVGAGIDLSLQLFLEGKSLACVSWTEVGISAALGAVGQVWGSGAFDLTNGSMKASNALRRYRNLQDIPATHDVHHWAIEKGSSLGKRLPDGFVNHPWNLNPISSKTHQAIHNQYNVLDRWLSGTPVWAKATELPVVGGIIADGTSQATGGCGCQ